MARILVADDERGICDAFAELLKAEGHEPIVVSSGPDAVRAVRERAPAAAFLDVRMPGGDGLSALEEIQAIAPQMPVIVMTAFGTLDTAHRAIDLGAFDYLGKPVELRRIRQLLERALHEPDGATETAMADAGGAPRLLGQSAVMQELFKKMALLAGNDLAILVTGESGVGKELVARAIHELGAHRDEPFVAVNCAAIPETLMEAELFGNEAGAFTDAKSKRIGRFEAAGQGTLFLDEVSELPYHLQSKLLRVLQENTFERLGSVKPIAFKARLVTASNRHLEEEVAAGRFRDDLYHRLNLASLVVPALRERANDIELLVGHFLSQANEQMGKAIVGIEPAALARLRAHTWPGNVRELEHTIKRSVLAARGTTITVHDLELPEASPNADEQNTLRQLLDAEAQKIVASPDEYGGSGRLYQHLMDAAAIAIIEAAMRLTDGNQVAAARLLGINRSTLRKKLADNA